MDLKKPAGLPEYLDELWDELEPQVFLGISEAGLEALCSQVYRMREARERVHTEGSVVNDGKGNAIPHPAIAIEKAAQVEIRAWLLKFGVDQ